MPERFETREHSSEGGDEVEWRLPASAAVTEALLRAINDRAPAWDAGEGKPALGRAFRLSKDQELKLVDWGQDRPKVVIIDSPKGPRVFDATGREHTQRTEYKYEGDEDAVFLKVDWPERIDEEPEIVSEGEAKSILRLLYSLDEMDPI